jgi:hypothetical protein
MRNTHDLVASLDEFVERISYLGKMCEFLGFEFTSSPRYNFRDALSHYVRFYEATNDGERISQAACFDEHLFRGVKDGIVFIVYEMRRTVNSALNDAVCGSRELQSGLRSLLHEFKDIELQIRKNSETGIHRVLQPFITALKATINKTQRFFKEHKLPPIMNRRP